MVEWLEKTDADVSDYGNIQGDLQTILDKINQLKVSSYVNVLALFH